MKKIAIVTVSFNTEKDTKNLLKSLKKIERDNYKLFTIIIDNGSEKVFKLVPEEQNEEITVIRSDKNTGFSGGFNLGISEAFKQDPDFILIINNDTEIFPDMLKNLVKVMDSDPKIGISVPKIYFAKGREFHKSRYKLEELGKVIWYAGGFMDWDNVKSVHRGVDEVDRGQYDKIEEVNFATGCCMMLKREVLEKVGAKNILPVQIFDDRYFLYYEDADVCIRVKKAGYKIMYVPKALLVHNNAASSGGPGNELHDYFLTRNQMLFGMRYAPIRSKIALMRQSIKLFFNGRPMQKLAIKDFYLGRFGTGSYI